MNRIRSLVISSPRCGRGRQSDSGLGPSASGIGSCLFLWVPLAVFSSLLFLRLTFWPTVSPTATWLAMRAMGQVENASTRVNDVVHMEGLDLYFSRLVLEVPFHFFGTIQVQSQHLSDEFNPCVLCLVGFEAAQTLVDATVQLVSCVSSF